MIRWLVLSLLLASSSLGGMTVVRKPMYVGAPYCGDAVRNGSEECDTADLGTGTCVTEGFNSGTLACDGSCFYDTSGCSSAYSGPIAFKNAYSNVTGYNGSGKTSVAVTGVTAAAGDTIIVFFTIGRNACSDASGDSIAASDGTNTLSEAVTYYDGSQTQCAGVRYKTNVSAVTGATVTVSWTTSAGYVAAAVLVYDGLNATTPLGATPPSTVAALTTPWAWSSGSITTAGSLDLLIGFAVDDSGSAATSTASGDATERLDVNPLYVNDKIGYPTGTVTGNFTENIRAIQLGIALKTE